MKQIIARTLTSLMVLVMGCRSRLTEGIDSLSPANATKLSFYFSGSKHVLAEVWQQRETSGSGPTRTKERTNLVQSHSTEFHEAAEERQP
jgi:hypothetical protein